MGATEDPEGAEARAVTDTSAGSGYSMVQRWLRISVGLSMSVLFGVSAAALAVVYFQERPVDATGASRQIADAVESGLINAYVPPQQVHRASSEMQESTDGRWEKTRFEVTVPSHLSTDGIKEVLRDVLLARGATVTDLPAAAGERRLRVSVGPFDMATVRLEGGAAAQPPLRDLRDTARAIAGEVAELLAGAGFSPIDAAADARVERQDQAMQWLLYTFDVEAAETIDVDGLLARITERLERRGAQSDIELDSSSAVRVLARLEGKSVLDLALRRPWLQPAEDEGGAPEPAPGVPLDASSSRARVPALGSLPRESDDGGVADREEAEPVPPPPRGRPESDIEGVPSETARATERPSAAIILDDGGYGGPVTDAALALDPRLTLAILPHTPAAAATAERALELGFEIMLHMPMETGASVAPFPGQLERGMEPTQIAGLTLAALESVPGASGVNNHTGSLFTSDRESMEHFLDALQGRELYFVDSRTTAESVAYRHAKSRGFRAAQRHVFLDHIDHRHSILAQVEQTIDYALAYGEVVAIGHFRPITIEVLADALPQFEAAGVDLVHASALAR